MTLHSVVLLLSGLLLLVTGALRLYVQIHECMLLKGWDRVRELLGWSVPFLLSSAFVGLYAVFPAPLLGVVCVAVVLTYFFSHPPRLNQSVRLH